jgi:hypothetical protein
MPPRANEVRRKARHHNAHQESIPMAVTMSPGMRKFALTVHVTVSVGVIGAIACFLALAIVGLASHDAHIVRGAYLAMDLVARFVIVPLAVAALLSALIQSLGTAWGLLSHK